MINIPSVPSPGGLDPATEIYLCRGIPWDRQYNHVRLFDSKSAAVSYCQGLSVYNTTSAKPVRDNHVFLPINQDYALEDCNYILYNNKQLYDFWVLAFITGTNYTSSNVTEIIFEIDVFQTYFYSCTLSQCYVKRHHWSRASDTIGANTLPEPVQEGYTRDYGGETYNYGLNGSSADRSLLMFHTNDQLEIKNGPGYIGNVYSGIYYRWGDPNTISGDVESTIAAGRAESIVAIYQCPQYCYNSTSHTLSVNVSDAYAGTSFRNNKMYTFPYCYVRAELYGGGSFELLYEKGQQGTVSVQLKGSAAPRPEVLLYANNYDGQFINLAHSSTFANFPSCAVLNNAYAQWVNSSGMSNSFNQLTSSITATAGLAALSGGLSSAVLAGGAAISGITGMVHSQIENAQAKQRPDTAVGSMGSGGSLFALSQLRANLTRLGWDIDSARAADDFMSIYGYTTNAVTTPTLHTRNLWNYVETADCNIQGNVAYTARDALNNIFNSGVFVWHTNAIGNFNIGGNG